MGTIKNEIIQLPRKERGKRKGKEGKWRDPFSHLHLWR
jgi:hypothetical protein